MRFLTLGLLMCLAVSAKAQLEAVTEDQIQALEAKNFILADRDDFFAPLRDSILRSIIPGVDLELVKDRMSCYDASMPLTINSTVVGFIKFFTIRKRNYTQTMLERQGFYFPIFEKYLAQYGLPDDLKYLSIVESGLKYNAKSRSGAVGLWQFMPGTGKDFRLEQNHLMDERQHPELATEAACKYLRTLYNMFNDWELALAAYNCGPGTILRAIKKTGKRSFWELYPHLPQETRSYVPQFVAVVYSMNYAAEHNIFPDADSVLRYVPTDTIKLNKNVCLAKLEKLLGCDSMQLRLLNPVARTTYFPSDFKYPLCVPADKKEVLLAYKDSLLALAELHEVPSMPVLTAKKSPSRQHKAHGVKSTSVEELAATPVIHKVQKGEGLYAVARQYKVTLQDLVAWNHLENTVLLEGQELIVKPAVKKHAVNNENEEAYTATAMHDKTANKPMVDTAQTIPMDNHDMAIAQNDDSACDDAQAETSKPQRKVHQAGRQHETPYMFAAKQGHKKMAKVYQVQRGDTLYSITKKFDGLTIEQIKKINKLKSEKLKVGQTLILG